ncbi:MAG: hypothetical protein Q8R37_03730 [Nanoarchaeota archaeon]|nr:hypothetical protein [Nanoarchaeota archaeon]
MTIPKAYLCSKEFSGKMQEDPDYLDLLAIKSLLEQNTIPYEHIADRYHLGDPQLKCKDSVYTGIKEVRDNLFQIKDYFYPNMRS